MSTTTIAKPIADRIVVKREAADEVTPGGIVLPDNAKDKPTRGRVVAVGSGRLLDDGTRCPMEVAEGDNVVFGAYGGTEVEIDGEELIVLRESDVLFVVS